MSVARGLLLGAMQAVWVPARRLGAALAVMAALALVLAAAPASAGVSHAFLFSFDGHETPAGSFGRAEGVAVDAATGDVYVSDVTNNVVDKFTATGTYLCQITGNSVPSLSECNGAGGSATPAGSFAFAYPTRLAVDDSLSPSDSSAGDLYVMDQGHRAIDKFGTNGEYLGQIGGPFEGELLGVAVDAEGNVWVYEVGQVGTVYEFAATGGLLLKFSFSQGSNPGFTVDSSDDTYATNAFYVAKFDSEGHELEDGRLECQYCLSVAADLSTNEVYAYSLLGSVSEFDETGAPIERFGEAQFSSSNNSVGAVAVDPVSGTIYVSRVEDGRVYAFARTPGPRVMPLAASNVQTKSATLNATVNPEGVDTKYQLEYGTDTNYGHALPASFTDVGSGSSPVAVSADIAELEGSTTYHYRIVATDANGITTRGADRTFTTLPVPLVHGVTVTKLTSESVDLGARIDPNGSDTTYHFEYGTSTAYGTSVPVPDGDIGAGTGDVVVSQHVSGLSPNMTYHWRVVARNANGTNKPADHTFRYDTAGSALPDNRAYELVTPAHKNGAVFGVFGGLPPEIAGDGSRMMAPTIQCFGDAESCVGVRGGAIGAPYALTRTSTGWVASALVPSAKQFEVNTDLAYNPDTGAAWFSMPTPPQNEDDFYVREPGGSFRDIGPYTPPSEGAQGSTGGQQLATPDFSHIVWRSLLIWPFDKTTDKITGIASFAYEYVGTGNTQPLLVGVSGAEGSTDLISICGTVPQEMSVDGRIVYFTAQGGVGCHGSGANESAQVPADELYARVDGEGAAAHTVSISQRSPGDCTSSACLSSAPASASFMGMSDDGSKVVFSSTQQLTDEASEGQENLYLYDFTNPSGHELLDISAHDSSGFGPRVLGPVAISADGSHVYFVAKGALTRTANAQGQFAQSGAENLYVFEHEAGRATDKIVFIAALLNADQNEWSRISVYRRANVTPDGRFLVFGSHARLTPDDASVSGARQVFRYDAQTGELIRISIGNDGFNDNGNRSTPTPCAGECAEDAEIAAPLYEGLRRDSTMSDDGSYVFFQSPVGLTPQALDDVLVKTRDIGIPLYAENVYEWHAGHVYLISDGRATEQGEQCAGSCLLGTDSSGANVFFSTADSLVPQDIDAQLDYYDARICTASDPCIKPTPAPLPPCLGEACHGTPAGTPLVPSAPSVTFNGQGNVSEASTGTVRKVAKGRPVRCAKRKRHRRGGCGRGKPRAKRSGRAVSKKGVK